MASLNRSSFEVSGGWAERRSARRTVLGSRPSLRAMARTFIPLWKSRSISLRSSGVIEILLDRSDLGHESSLKGVQHAALDVGESGKIVLHQLTQAPLEVLEAAFELSGGGPERRGSLIRE